MKKCGKFLAAMLSVVFLTLAGNTTARAAEVQAPFNADQLMAVVNAQCANLSSMQQVIAENIQMTDLSSGMMVTADMVMDSQQNRTYGHTSMVMNMSALGYSSSYGIENYTAMGNGVMASYTLNPVTGKWNYNLSALTPAETVAYANPFVLSGFDPAGAVVTTDGSVYKFTTVVNPANMAKFSESLREAGFVLGNAAFPVTVEIDAATMLPKSMTVTMCGLKMSGVSDITANVVAVGTYGGFNQYNELTVPDAVVASAAG